MYKLTNEAIDKLTDLTTAGRMARIVLIPKPGAMFDVREATPDDSGEKVCGVWVDLVRGERYIKIVHQNKKVFEFWPDA